MLRLRAESCCLHVLWWTGAGASAVGDHPAELLGARMIGAEVTGMIEGHVVGRTLETTEEDLMNTVLPASDGLRGDARGRARRLRAGDPHLGPDRHAPGPEHVGLAALGDTWPEPSDRRSRR